MIGLMLVLRELPVRLALLCTGVALALGAGGGETTAGAAGLDPEFSRSGVQALKGEGPLAAIAAGREGRIWVLARGRLVSLTERGRLDSRFAERGVLQLSDGSLSALEGLRSGAVIVAGTRAVGAPVVRYQPSVWLVSPSGRVVSRTDLPLPARYASVLRVTAAPARGGRVVIAVAGRSEVGRPRVLTALFRVTEANRLDRRFGRDGVVRASSPPHGEVADGGVLVRPNGKLIIAGGCYSCPFPKTRLSQYDSRGRLDEGFGDEGLLHLRPRKLVGGGGLALAPDGALLIHAGRTLRVAGERVDRSFGVAGVTATGFRRTVPGRPVVLPSGTLISAGAFHAYSSFRLVAHTREGHLDHHLFGGDGRFRLPASRRFPVARAHAMTVDRRGRLLVAGEVTRPRRCCGTPTVWRLNLGR